MNKQPNRDVNNTPVNTSTRDYTRGENTSARDHTNAGEPSRPHRQGIMGLLTIATALTLSACGTTAPQPITTVVTSNNATENNATDVDQSAESKGIEIEPLFEEVNSQDVNGVKGFSNRVRLRFDTPMDHASTERAINIYPGEYAPVKNPASFTALGLTSMCNGSWRVRNPNTSPISFTWDVYKGNEKGVGVVPANSDAFFTSSQGANTVRVFVGGKQQQSKATNPAACTSSANTFVWSEDSKRVTIKPSSALVLGSTYSMTVSTFAKDSFGAVSLTKPYVKKFVVQQNSSTTGVPQTGMLSPGGAYRFANGMVVGSTDFLYEPVSITVEKVDPVALLLPQIYTPVSDFIRVKTSGITEPGVQYITVTFPYPVDVNPKTLVIGSYLPEKIFKRNSSTPEKLVLRLNVVLEIDEVRKTVTFRTALPEDSGYIFVLLKAPRIVNQAKKLVDLQAQALPLTYQTYCGIGTLNIFNSQSAIELKLANCDLIKRSLDQEIINMIKDAYDKFVLSMQLQGKILPKFLGSIVYVNNQDVECYNVLGYYYARNNGILYVCVADSSSNVINETLKDTLRHELFHSVQEAFVRESSPAWVYEGTAEAAVNSDTKMRIRPIPGRYPKVLNNSLYLEEKDGVTDLAYTNQDFWVFAGRQNNKGLAYLKEVFKNPTSRDTVNASLGSPNVGFSRTAGLSDAYWQFAKDQAYEYKTDIRSIGATCNIVTDDRQTIVLSPLESYVNLTGFQGQPYKVLPATVDPLSSRMYPIGFAGNVLRKVVRVRVKSSTDASFKYKVYLQGETGCSGVSDGPRNFLQLNSSMKLYVLISNTDLVKSTTFTVILEDAANPIRVSGAPGQTIESKIILPNLGSIVSNLNYTVYPVGVHADTSDSSTAFLPRRVRNPAAAYAVSRPANSVFESVLYSPRAGLLSLSGVTSASAARASNVGGANVASSAATNGPGTLEIPVKAICPAVGGQSHENIDVVYETGLIDDHDTPGNLSDDTRELEVVTVPVWVDCGNPLTQAGRDTVIKPGGQMFTWGLIRDYLIPENVSVTYRYFEYTTGILVPNLSNVAAATDNFALTNDGSLWLYGNGNPQRNYYSGGDPLCPQWQAPVKLTTLSSIVSLRKDFSFSGSTSFVVGADGSVQSVSLDNSMDRCRYQESDLTVTPVAGLEDIVDFDGFAAVNSAGNGFLKIPSSGGYATGIAGLDNVRKIRIVRFSDGYAGVVLKQDGSVWKLLVPNFDPAQARVEPLTSTIDAIDVEAGQSNLFVIAKNSSLSSLLPSMIYSVADASFNPALVAGLGPVVAVGGRYTMMAVTTDGAVYVWGDSVYPNQFEPCLNGLFSVYYGELTSLQTSCPLGPVVTEPRQVTGVNVLP